MAANAVVRARVQEHLKEQASEVLADMGLTISDAIRIMLTRVVADRALPFDLTPNAKTAETLRRSERGEDVHRVSGAEELFEDLGI